jgi:pentatricopeptide repeat protein
MIEHKERKSRELTDKEKEAFLARREQRLQQSHVKKELHKSFRQADMETVWKLHDKLSHRDQWTYNQMIAVAAKGGFVKKAFSIFQKMKKVPIQPTMGTYHWLLQACANGKEKDGQYLARAFYVVEMMEESKLQLNLHSYNLLLQICANANDIEVAAEVLKKMSASGVAADISSLSSLLNCTQGGALEPIQQVWNELKTKFQPDTRAWNTYLNVLKESGFHSEAIAAYKEMIKTPVPKEDDPEGPKVLPIPSPHTLSLLLDSCNEHKDFSEGRQIFLRILTDENWRKNLQVDELLLQSMLRIAARLKANMVFAVEALNQERKLPISRSTRELYIMAYGRTGDLKGSMRHFEAARLVNELNLRCFTGLLIACRTASDPDRAYLSFEILRRCNIRPDAVYLKLLRDILTANNRLDLIKKLDSSLSTSSPPPSSSDAVARPSTASIESKESNKSIPETKHDHSKTSKTQQGKGRPIYENEEDEDFDADPELNDGEWEDHDPIQASNPRHYGTSHNYKAKSARHHSQTRADQSADEEPRKPIPTAKASSFFPQTSNPTSTTGTKGPSVILPSNEPSAARSVFFAAQRAQQTRFNSGEGML